MTTIPINRREVSVSKKGVDLFDLVNSAGHFYGDLNPAVGSATSPQELVDTLRQAGTVLAEQQMQVAYGTPAHDRVTNRISHLTCYINQVKRMYEGEVR